MSEVARITALARKDARGVARDSFLLWMAIYPLVLALAMRIAVHLLDVEGLSLWLAPATIVLAPSLLGMLFGFALIEEREQDTLVLLRVLPMRRGTLWTYWVGGGFAAAAVLSLLCSALYGRAPTRPGLFLSATAAAALTAPLLALLMSAFASDKIQGLAVGKILSASGAVPILAFAVGPAWQPLLWWSPWYWIYAALLQAFAEAGELAALGRPFLPSYPDAVWLVVPTLFCVALLATAAFVAQRRAP